MRVTAGVGTAVLFGVVVVGLGRLVRSQPSADRGLVVMAWAGWTLFGLSLAVGFSLWDMLYTFLNLGYRIQLEWVITRGLVVGLAWAGVTVVGLVAWRRGRVALTIQDSAADSGA
jgi:hypothetical protein